MEWLLVVLFPAVMYAFYGEEIVGYFKEIKDEILDLVDYIVSYKGEEEC